MNAVHRPRESTYKELVLGYTFVWKLLMTLDIDNEDLLEQGDVLSKGVCDYACVSVYVCKLTLS
jgi:hypothetical protein